MPKRTTVGVLLRESSPILMGNAAPASDRDFVPPLSAASSTRKMQYVFSSPDAS